MRLATLLFIAMISIAFSIMTTTVDAKTTCVSKLGHSVCEYPNEPAYVACLQVDGKQARCVVDPCGTTACF